MTQFVSLHNQTTYSILDSVATPKKLLQAAKDLGQTAIAITEHGSFASAWECWKLSKEIGIKLIIGCEFYFLNDAKDRGEDKLRHITLLAKNAIGYRNILTLNKKGFDNNTFGGKRVYSIIDWELLEEHKEGVVCLTACGNGIVSQLLMNGKFDEANTTIERLKKMFGDDLGLEIQPNNMDRGSNFYNDKIDQRFLNRTLINLGKKHDIKVVPTTNTHYVTKEESVVHDVLLAIGSHQPIYSNFRLRYPVPDFYLKSGDEVKDFFSRNYGEELALELCSNSVYFADKCEVPEWIDPKFSNPSGKELPVFPVKDQEDYPIYQKWLETQPADIQALEEDKSYLRYWCEVSFESRVPDLDPEQRKLYDERIAEEMDVLEYHGFSSYMLIVADYIKWAKVHNIAIGAGRGSAGGSLVAYLTGIHQADPIKYNLIFARFHNKEKSSFPDIDVDIAPSGRGLVQTYLKNKYGHENVAHVSNVNTITPKVYVRDIARACELGGSRDAAVQIGNLVADCIPADIKSIDDACAKLPLFAEYCKKYPEFLKYKQLCGQYRAWSTHAGGIIISARPLTGLIPLRRDKDGSLAVEYDKNYAEENGLVKMDTLGLSTLDTIGTTMKLIKQAGKEVPTIVYDDADQKTYELISKGKTFKVFQFGTSAGTIDLCKRIKPLSIVDLANINALARPSARDMRNDFIATKDGRKKMTLLHPNLGRAFNSTFGFGLYEECLMYLAQDIAGWTLHSADRLRKLTKDKGKDPAKARKLRQEFIDDAVKNNINEQIATRIWDEVIDLFQGYGFNVSHAVLYSMIGYETAYLKAHFPIEFLTANLMEEIGSSSPNAKTDIEKIKKELRENRVKILPPNLNTSQLTYTLQGEKLLTGLDALKFVGEEAIKDILEKRPFKSFFDFMVRVSSSKVRANNIQALAAAGALDEFKLDRKAIFLYCSDYRKKLQIWLKKHDPNTEEFHYPFPKDVEWSMAEMFALEMHYLNEPFICQPYKAYKNFFLDYHETIADVRKAQNKDYLKNIKVIVKDFFEFKVKKETSKMYGKAMAKVVVEDKFGNQCSCTIFPDRWEALQDHMKTINKKVKFESGLALNFSGSVNMYEDELGIIFDKIYSFQPPPPLPSDLKAKKINLKEAKKKDGTDIYKAVEETKLLDDKDLFEQLEDSLYDEGLIDLDVDNEDD